MIYLTKIIYEMEISEKLEHIYNYVNFSDLLIDGLIHTYPIRTTIKLITRDLNGIKANIDIEETNRNYFFERLFRFLQ
jgi:hypothetical protein